MVTRGSGFDVPQSELLSRIHLQEHSRYYVCTVVDEDKAGIYLGTWNEPEHE